VHAPSVRPCQRPHAAALRRACAQRALARPPGAPPASRARSLGQRRARSQGQGRAQRRAETQVLTPQRFGNVAEDADVFNHSNRHFWEVLSPGLAAWGMAVCTGSNLLLRAGALMVRCPRLLPRWSFAAPPGTLS